MRLRRLGVLGGTFDPIHNAHLVAAAAVRNALELDLVLFVPTGESWHKSPGPLASPEDRLSMANAAIAGHDGFAVSSVDIDRAGPTYTVDTLSALEQAWAVEHPHEPATWFFITGADALADVPNWRDPEGIMSCAQLVGVSRPGHALDAGSAMQGRFVLVEVATPDLSSTQIRERVRDGKSIAGLVPDAVAQYIAQHGLYGPTEVRG